ncbi:uncharacterized protein LOC126549835 [Aphis gossypii]|uniref:uncharacterized protein LOC126549835 n=1 Tax=Aphis gossypii TaxID=80765 RepID=UPI00215950A2|nr:uncharacterized protein LOC126549835 [Aphis gossypii]
MLRAYCHHKHSSWVKWLETVEYWLNNTTHHSTGFTPNQILTGKTLQLPLNKFVNLPEMNDEVETAVMIQLAQKKLKKSAINRNTTKDQGRRFPTYVVGQQVLVKEHRLSSAIDGAIHKFFLLYRGPYTIVQVLRNNTVVIEDEKSKPVTQNMKNIKLYVPPDPGKQEEQKAKQN